MFHPDDEALAALVLGEEAGLTEAELEHARSCPQCSTTVESFRQTARLVRAGSQAAPLTAPPASVWARIEAELDAGEADRAAAGGSSEPAATGAPRTPATTEGATPENVHVLDTQSDRAPRPGRRPAVGWGIGLAAAGVAIGLVTGRALWQEPAAPAVTTVATAELDTLDSRQRLGDASLLRTAGGVDLRISTSTLDPGEGYLEVWLINTDGKRMVSVGVLGGDAPTTFPVSQTLIDEGYVVVDISREGFDDRPEHSGDSVARGTLST